MLPTCNCRQDHYLTFIRWIRHHIVAYLTRCGDAKPESKSSAAYIIRRSGHSVCYTKTEFWSLPAGAEEPIGVPHAETGRRPALRHEGFRLSAASGQSSDRVGKKSFDSPKCCCDNGIRCSDVACSTAGSHGDGRGAASTRTGGFQPDKAAERAADCVLTHGLTVADGGINPVGERAGTDILKKAGF